MTQAVIAIKLQGGLGNNLFQSAFAMAFSMHHNCDYELLNFHQNCIANKQWLGRDANYYASEVFQRFDLRNKHDLPEITYPESEYHFCEQPFKEGYKNIYRGYFQSEKYFYEFSEQIKSVFSPSCAVLNYIHNKHNLNFKDHVSIHVRLGDYVSQQDNHPVVTMKYLTDAIRYFSPDQKFLIMSDDIQWCRENLIGYVSPNSVFVENELDYVSLYMMSLCSHNIISNSSFSWWSAWLNHNPDKVVIRPDIWFGKNYAHLNTSDLCPEKWLKFSVQ